MKNWQQRASYEKQELDEKIRKLENFIDSVDFEPLSIAERIRLLEQERVMKKYSSILDARINAFDKSESDYQTFKITKENYGRLKK